MTMKDIKGKIKQVSKDFKVKRIKKGTKLKPVDNKYSYANVRYFPKNYEKMKDTKETIIEIQSFIRNGNTKCNILTDCVLREIITKRDNEWKSAVEWSKKRVEDHRPNYKWTKKEILEIIDKAFEGGMKK